MIHNSQGTVFFNPVLRGWVDEDKYFIVFLGEGGSERITDIWTGHPFPNTGRKRAAP